MSGKIFTIIILLIALVVGIFAAVLPSERLHDLFIFIKFFDAMLPILAVGALIKYLLCCSKHNN